MEEEISNTEIRTSPTKKYLIIAVIIILLAGIIFGAFYLYKQNKCEQVYKTGIRNTFNEVKCISECPADTQANYDSCLRVCGDATVKSNVDILIQIRSCTKQFEKLTPTDPFSNELANCALIITRSIRNHLNDSSVPIEKSCIDNIEHKYYLGSI